MKASTRLYAILAIFFLSSSSHLRAQSPPEWSTMGGMDRATQLIAAGRLAEAIQAGKEQLSQAEARLGKDHPDLIPYLQTLGAACFARHDYDEAEIVYKRGLEISERSFGKSDERVRSFTGPLFAIYTIEKRPTEAAEMMRRTRPVQ